MEPTISILPNQLTSLILVYVFINLVMDSAYRSPIRCQSKIFNKPSEGLAHLTDSHGQRLTTLLAGYCPACGAFDLGLAVSVPLPIVTGIFMLLRFQSRLTPGGGVLTIFWVTGRLGPFDPPFSTYVEFWPLLLGSDVEYWPPFSQGL